MQVMYQVFVKCGASGRQLAIKVLHICTKNGTPEAFQKTLGLCPTLLPSSRSGMRRMVPRYCDSSHPAIGDICYQIEESDNVVVSWTEQVSGRIKAIPKC